MDIKNDFHIEILSPSNNDLCLRLSNDKIEFNKKPSKETIENTISTLRLQIERLQGYRSGLMASLDK
jgi:hypothetical protein